MQCLELFCNEIKCVYHVAEMRCLNVVICFKQYFKFFLKLFQEDSSYLTYQLCKELRFFNQLLLLHLLTFPFPVPDSFSFDLLHFLVFVSFFLLSSFCPIILFLSLLLLFLLLSSTIATKLVKVFQGWMPEDLPTASLGDRSGAVDCFLFLIWIPLFSKGN